MSCVEPFYITTTKSAIGSSDGSKHAISDEKQRMVTYLIGVPGNFEIGAVQGDHTYLELSKINMLSF